VLYVNKRKAVTLPRRAIDNRESTLLMIDDGAYTTIPNPFRSGRRPAATMHRLQYPEKR
jgi:hypothetical protein